MLHQLNPSPFSGHHPYSHPDYEFPKEVHNLLVTAQTTHVSLSAMADSKASTLMASTFVVFALTVGEITAHKVTVPLLLLAGFSALATILCVLAIKPSLPKPTPTIAPGTNPLFFGFFAGVPEQEFVDHLIDTMRSEESTYRAMARDLHQNGKVLYARKYLYLSYAYSVFLVGFGATIMAFAWEAVVG